jgi:hypothetical protein
MADSMQHMAEQFQAFASRWWFIASHPLQSLADWWTPRFRPEAYRQQMIIDTEGPVTVLYREQPLGHQTTALGQTERVPSQETPLKYTAAEELAMLQRTLNHMGQDTGPLPSDSLPPALREQTSQRSIGYDGPDDVRLPREIGPALGSVEAALIEARFEANRARVDEREALLDQLAHLHARLDASTRALDTPSPTRQQGQEMGW